MPANRANHCGSGLTLLIRAEGEADRAAVRAVNIEAFEGPAEADLVDARREQAQPVVSLVAERWARAMRGSASARSSSDITATIRASASFPRRGGTFAANSPRRRRRSWRWNC